MTWDTLRPVLVKLAARRPNPVRDGPDPHVVGPRRSPFHLGLEAWAVDVAADLHRRFGREVVLSVGYFGFPSRLPVDRWGRPQPAGIIARSPAEERAQLVDPTALTVELAGNLVIRSGHDTDAPLVVANHSGRPVEIHRLRAVIVDPGTGVTVGDALPPGARNAPGSRQNSTLEVGAGQTVAVALRVGTASRDPVLGYAVPAGEWALRVYFEQTGHVVRAPLLPITIN